MADEKPLEITVTKIDGARRHIEAAILLWFQDADPCVVVTLIAAGHHVCNDLTKDSKKSPGKGPFFLNPSLIDEDKWREYSAEICRVENFFKHADQPGDDTPDVTLTFRPITTDFYIFDAIELFKMLHGEYTDLMRAFRHRFALFHPDGFPDFAPRVNEPMQVHLSRIGKLDFLTEFMRDAARKRGD
jgi:hypothetical protein